MQNPQNMVAVSGTHRLLTMMHTAGFPSNTYLSFLFAKESKGHDEFPQRQQRKVIGITFIA